MLRSLLGEPRREDHGILAEAFRRIDVFIRKMARVSPADPGEAKRHRHFLLWAKALRTSLDELEESLHVCAQFRKRVVQKNEIGMSPEERDHYRCCVYFYKNALVRVFSTLDKLGYFLNGFYNLHTEKIKSRFSYFTVLRRMRELQAVPGLERRLSEWKDRCGEPLKRLRLLRNMEIHWINAELEDDWSLQDSRYPAGAHIENLDANLDDLRQGYEMVAQVLAVSFREVSRTLK
jgi:hypothetical protein